MPPSAAILTWLAALLWARLPSAQHADSCTPALSIALSMPGFDAPQRGNLDPVGVIGAEVG